MQLYIGFGRMFQFLWSLACLLIFVSWSSFWWVNDSILGNNLSVYLFPFYECKSWFYSYSRAGQQNGIQCNCHIFTLFLHIRSPGINDLDYHGYTISPLKLIGFFTLLFDSLFCLFFSFLFSLLCMGSEEEICLDICYCSVCTGGHFCAYFLLTGKTWLNWTLS